MTRPIALMLLAVLIALVVAPAATGFAQGPTATPAPTTPPSFTEEEIQFTDGPDTLYGTLSLPNVSGKRPAALIIAGSGPTNRNGDNPLIFGDVGTLRNIANTLAAAGVVSLRYDKIGTGQTGLASHATDASKIDFELYVTGALAAYNALTARPEVDPAKTVIIGHSEGGLIALVLAERLKGNGQPAALVLAAPISVPYFELLRRQITEQFAAAVKAGLFTQAQANIALAELDAIIANLLEKGTPPEKITFPAFVQLFGNPINNRFLAQAGRYDPRQMVAGWAKPALLFCAEFDVQISCKEVEALRAAFPAANAGVQLVTLKGVNHVLKEVTKPSENPLEDYGNPALPFSRMAADALTAFVTTIFGQASP